MESIIGTINHTLIMDKIIDPMDNRKVQMAKTTTTITILTLIEKIKYLNILLIKFMYKILKLNNQSNNPNLKIKSFQWK